MPKRLFKYSNGIGLLTAELNYHASVNEASYKHSQLVHILINNIYSIVYSAIWYKGWARKRYHSCFTSLCAPWVELTVGCSAYIDHT